MSSQSTWMWDLYAEYHRMVARVDVNSIMWTKKRKRKRICYYSLESDYAFTDVQKWTVNKLITKEKYLCIKCTYSNQLHSSWKILFIIKILIYMLVYEILYNLYIFITPLNLKYVSATLSTCVGILAISLLDHWLFSLFLFSSNNIYSELTIFAAWSFFKCF